ncbi:Arginase/deacetylase [Epithele typhae]|uniref:Arginase/deacetylase n=1 Tax=Epithele typhae TaxID=378194 RepID=UPI00200886DD|nr:Arginase/deacetylase [Epithele typhae]KAH9924694.1 Arginase/deacetylase [Epithele typhae]
MPPTSIYLQKSMPSASRPERLRAVNVGLAAAIARMEEGAPTKPAPANAPLRTEEDEDELTKALEKLQLSTPCATQQPARVPATIVHSGATVDILNHAAVKFVHGDIDDDVYLKTLKKWTQDSHDKINQGGSEIPEGYNQGDLYLCPGSLDAIQGALGTMCEAVDSVVGLPSPDTPSQAFVAVRPPGHHCGEDTPSGFCFVNNVAVGAAHAYLKYKINRVVVLDIDLHHGNGTQAIAWQINEETYRKQLEGEAGAPHEPGLQVYYGSIHDILSYPCEDGKTSLVQAASVSIHGPHGQHIENIHLSPYTSEDEFWDKLYAGPYSRLLQKAGEFLENTGKSSDDVLVFISCGFDASEHEHPGMSRHGRKVPTSFYYRFARDTRAFASRYANGRLISVLEGGYSDRALASGAMAHLAGFLEDDTHPVDPTWWSRENLIALEAATKKRRGGRPSNTTPPVPWLARTVELFASIDASHTLAPISHPRAPIAASDRTLRDRKPARASPAASPGKKIAAKKGAAAAITFTDEESDSVSTDASVPEEGGAAQSASKKLPRVILKLGPQPNA